MPRGFVTSSEDMEEKKDHGVANEPVALDYEALASGVEVDYNFGNVDLGYPRTLEEVNEALDRADAVRNDPSEWISSIEFHNRLEQKYPWLR